MPDVTLGPWSAEHPEDKPLADAMGAQAKKTIDNTQGWTAKERPKSGNPTGFGIEGRVNNVVTKGDTTRVSVTFTVTIDGFVTNTVISSHGASNGSNGGQYAVEALTVEAINKILQTLKTGKVVKQG